MHGALVPVQVHALAGLRTRRARCLGQVGLQRDAVRIDLDAGEGAEVLHLAHPAGGARAGRRAEADALGAQHRAGVAGQAARGVAVEHVGRADELRDEARRRRVVDLPAACPPARAGRG